jgi:hypothetical protein
MTTYNDDEIKSFQEAAETGRACVRDLKVGDMFNGYMNDARRLYIKGSMEYRLFMVAAGIEMDKITLLETSRDSGRITRIERHA